MAIVRFLDKQNNCYQVSPPETPILIYLSDDEKKTLLASKKGECLFLMDSTLDEEKTHGIIESLNTKDPKIMS